MDTFQRTAVVGSCTSRHEAELQRHVLEESGIPTSIGSDDAGGLHPELGFSRCATYRILVPEGEVDRARDILADFEPEALPIDGDAAAFAEHADPDATASADIGFPRGAAFWVALVLAVILGAMAASNVLNVFTGS